MNQDQNYGVLFRNNSLYISFSKGFTYRIESYPTFRCWKRKQNGKWKSISYIYLDLKKRSIFVFRNQYERPFLKKSDYMALKIKFENPADEFPIFHKSDQGIKSGKWLESNRKFVYSEIDKYIDQIPEKYKSIVAFFNTSYSLQFRLLREFYLDKRLVYFSKNLPLIAYIYVLRKYFSLSESISNCKNFQSFCNIDLKTLCNNFNIEYKYLNLYLKLDYSLLDFRLFELYNHLFNDIFYNSILSNLDKINLNLIDFLEIAKRENIYNFCESFLLDIIEKFDEIPKIEFKNVINRINNTKSKQISDTLVEMLKQGFNLFPNNIFTSLNELKEILFKNRIQSSLFLEPFLKEQAPFKDTIEIQSIGRIPNIYEYNYKPVLYYYQIKEPEIAFIALKRVQKVWEIYDIEFMYYDFRNNLNRILTEYKIRKWIRTNNLRINSMNWSWSLTYNSRDIVFDTSPYRYCYSLSNRNSNKYFKINKDFFSSRIQSYDYLLLFKKSIRLALLFESIIFNIREYAVLSDFYLEQFSFFSETEIILIMNSNFLSRKILNKFSLVSLKPTISSSHFWRRLFNYRPLEKFLRHMKKIDEDNVVYLRNAIYYSLQKENLSISFFEEVSNLENYREKKYYFEVRHYLFKYNPKWRIDSIKKLENYQELYFKELKEKAYKKRLKKAIDFPESPFDFYPCIAQILNAFGLFLEGKIQGTFVYLYKTSIESGNCLIFSVTAFERCTMRLTKKKDRWILAEIKSRFNQEASKETMDYIRIWMRKNGIQV